MSPSEWREQGVDDRALMLAYTMFHATWENFRHEWREDVEKQKKEGRTRASNPLEDLKRHAGLK